MTLIADCWKLLSSRFQYPWLLLVILAAAAAVLGQPASKRIDDGAFGGIGKTEGTSARMDLANT